VRVNLEDKTLPMNITHAPTLREHWAEGMTTIGSWLSIPSTLSAEVAGGAGFHYTCLDLQHGAIGYQEAVSMTQAILLGGGHPIARVPWNEPGIIGQVLDAGIEGVIVPMVNSAAEAQSAVRSARYLPMGARSYGPVMAGLRRPNYFEWAATGIAVIPMIETVEALRNIDEILQVPGIDAIYVGPADLSISLGLKPANNDGEAPFDEALAAIVSACSKYGIVPGIHTTTQFVAKRLEQGFRMVTVSSDAVALRTQLAAELAIAKGALPAAVSGSVY
jgi:4-hydroxy-2-oxoheptanedioate aldolase